MTNQNEEQIVINEEEEAQFIEEFLEANGFGEVSRELIDAVIAGQYFYMQSIGLIEEDEDGGEK